MQCNCNPVNPFKTLITWGSKKKVHYWIIRQQAGIAFMDFQWANCIKYEGKRRKLTEILKWDCLRKNKII